MRNWAPSSATTTAEPGLTVEQNGSELVADIAWVISPIHQGQGMASEATKEMTGWLRSKGVSSFVAFVHPEHYASMGVARNQGLHPTPMMEAGEPLGILAIATGP